MHRLTATDTPMVRYTRTIFPSYAHIPFIRTLLSFTQLYHDYVNFKLINKKEDVQRTPSLN